MSGHGAPHDDDAHDDADHDHEDDHAAVPVLDEPHTPLWLTMLGIGLFLVAGILFVATREGGKTTAELTAQGAPEGSPAGSAALDAGRPPSGQNAPAPNPGQ